MRHVKGEWTKAESASDPYLANREHCSLNDKHTTKPMRVLQVVGGMNAGGIETFIMSVYRSLDRDKVQFDFLYSTQEKCFYDEEILSLGGRIHRISAGRKNYLGSARCLEAFFKANQYETVHFHVGQMSFLLPLKVACRCGVPTRILHAHCAYSRSYGLRDAVNALAHRYNRRYGLNYATHLFACSEDAAEWFGYPYIANRLDWQYIPNGIDVKRFSYSDSTRLSARAEFGFEKEDLIIGNIGRLSPQKNQAFLLRSFKLMLEQNPNVKLLLVGSGGLESMLHDDMERFDILDRVVLLKNRSDTERLYCAMDAFAFPSVFEGLGIVLIEAQANGLPCVVSDAIPKEAIVSDGVEVVPLARGERVWADALASAAVKERALDGWERVSNAGFEIAEVAQRLQAFYLESVEGDL